MPFAPGEGQNAPWGRFAPRHGAFCPMATFSIGGDLPRLVLPCEIAYIIINWYIKIPFIMHSNSIYGIFQPIFVLLAMYGHFGTIIDTDLAAISYKETRKNQFSWK